MENRRFNYIILGFLLISTFVGVLSVRSGNNQKPANSYAATIPSPEPFSETSAVSPDGKSTLVLTQKPGKINTVWSFAINDKNIFKETLSPEIKLIIPFNTFSPDNKYFFLKAESPGFSTYKVYIVNGKPFTDENLGLDFSVLFNARHPNFVITDVTGWAAPNLIIINTDKSGGGQGPSFWFDVSSKSFIQLSTRFN